MTLAVFQRGSRKVRLAVREKSEAAGVLQPDQPRYGVGHRAIPAVDVPRAVVEAGRRGVRAVGAINSVDSWGALWSGGPP